MLASGLPEGVSPWLTVGILSVICIVTVTLRQLPFSAVHLLRKNNLVEMLGFTMPVGVMIVLVIYTMFGYSHAPGGVWAGLIATAVTLGLHWWRRSAALSIVGGTACYMVLVNLVFS